MKVRGMEMFQNSVQNQNDQWRRKLLIAFHFQGLKLRPNKCEVCGVKSVVRGMEMCQNGMVNKNGQHPVELKVWIQKGYVSGLETYAYRLLLMCVHVGAGHYSKGCCRVPWPHPHPMTLTYQIFRQM